MVNEASPLAGSTSGFAADDVETGRAGAGVGAAPGFTGVGWEEAPAGAPGAGAAAARVAGGAAGFTGGAAGLLGGAAAGPPVGVTVADAAGAPAAAGLERSRLASTRSDSSRWAYERSGEGVALTAGSSDTTRSSVTVRACTSP